MRLLINIAILSYFVIAIFMGCRGWHSENPPFHVNPNMDTQPKYKPYRKNTWFKDGRDMRPRIAGVVARGDIVEDSYYSTGKVNDKFVTGFPVQLQVDSQFMRTGQKQFNVYCAPCHSRTGDGKGLVGEKLQVVPTSIHDDYIANLPNGHFFDVISDGIRTMPGYKHQLSIKDRWAVIAYIRALQLNQKTDVNWLKKSGHLIKVN